MCYRIVRWFGGWWEVMGWLLFGIVILSALTGTAFEAPTVGLLLGFALLVWWVLDAVTQELEWWQLAIGIVLVVGGIVTPLRGFIVLLICWVFYFFRLRSDEDRA